MSSATSIDLRPSHIAVCNLALATETYDTRVAYSFKMETSEINASDRILDWIAGAALDAVNDGLCGPSSCIFTITRGRSEDKLLVCDPVVGESASCSVHGESLRVLHTDACDSAQIQEESHFLIAEVLQSRHFLQYLSDMSGVGIARLDLEPFVATTPEPVRERSRINGGGLAALILSGLALCFLGTLISWACCYGQRNWSDKQRADESVSPGNRSHEQNRKSKRSSSGIFLKRGRSCESFDETDSERPGGVVRPLTTISVPTQSFDSSVTHVDYVETNIVAETPTEAVAEDSPAASRSREVQPPTRNDNRPTRNGNGTGLATVSSIPQVATETAASITNEAAMSFQTENDSQAIEQSQSGGAESRAGPRVAQGERLAIVGLTNAKSLLDGSARDESQTSTRDRQHRTMIHAVGENGNMNTGWPDEPPHETIHDELMPLPPDAPGCKMSVKSSSSFGTSSQSLRKSFSASSSFENSALRSAKSNNVNSSFSGDVFSSEDREVIPSNEERAVVATVLSAESIFDGVETTIQQTITKDSSSSYLFDETDDDNFEEDGHEQEMGIEQNTGEILPPHVPELPQSRDLVASPDFSRLGDDERSSKLSGGHYFLGSHVADSEDSEIEREMPGFQSQSEDSGSDIEKARDYHLLSGGSDDVGSKSSSSEDERFVYNHSNYVAKQVNYVRVSNSEKAKDWKNRKCMQL